LQILFILSFLVFAYLNWWIFIRDGAGVYGNFFGCGNLWEEA
jgi:hypothetical protein